MRHRVTENNKPDFDIGILLEKMYWKLIMLNEVFSLNNSTAGTCCQLLKKCLAYIDEEDANKGMPIKCGIQYAGL